MVGHHRRVKFGVLLALSYCAGGRANLANYPNCTHGYTDYIGDGVCDLSNNNEACGWDGGDCCECTCISESVYGCDTESFVCLDPTSSCADPSLADYVDCGGNLASFGDAACDAENNNEDCGWDGGDCCECTCIGGSDNGCEPSEFFCKDPNSTCIHPLVIEYESCEGDFSFYGNGWCDAGNNNEACGWDGGDCCECTCNGYWCSFLAGDTKCEDPEAASGENSCMDWPSDPPPCSSEVQHKWVVNDVQQAQSLAEALNCSGGRFEVEWHGNIVVNQTLAVLGGTVINVTGVGSGARIDGGDTTGLFIVINSSLHLRNIVLTNGNSTLGGAIAALGSRVLLNQTSFVGNTAEHNGGALFVAEGSTLASGNETYFTNNSAGRQGGAVCARGYTHITWTGRAVFFNNSAGFDGGAMAISFGSSVLWAGAGGANFSNNTAGIGGGLFNYSGSGATWEGEVRFEGNTAYRGGGLYMYNSDALWSEASSYFRYNFANDSGGALYAIDSSISFAGKATFSSNFVGSDGGALYIGHNTTASWLASANFVDNYADGDGGALVMEDSTTALWMGDTSFINNSARYEGGALSVTLSNTIFWAGKLTFSNNNAGDNGGALYLEGNASWETETTFVNNSADSGGALYLLGTSYWKGETTFADNAAASQGGAVYIAGAGGVSWSSNTSYINNSAGDNGGALYLEGNASWEGDTSFVNKSADGGGGALYLLGTSYWEGETTFADNAAASQGGAVYIAGSGGASWSASTSFINNSAGGNGGALYLEGTASWEGETTFVNNSADSGGAMSLSGDVTLSSNAKIIFHGNSASVYGGAVFISSVGVGPKFYGAQFHHNHAQIGGGVYAVLSGTVETKPLNGIIVYPTTFLNCIFVSNTADTSGGGVSTASGKDDFVNTTFSGNTARTGGALQLSGTASITGCLFEDNIAESGGGPAIINIGYISKTKSSSFLNNILDCENGTFFKFSKGNDEELYDVCEGCVPMCDTCTFEEPITVPECTSLSVAGIEHATSSGGGTTIEKLKINKGYWRATATSPQVLKCYNGDACRGGVTGAKEFCSEGYEGPYCSVCSTGYTANLNFRCTPCTGRKWGIAIASIASGVSLVIGVVVVLYLSSAGIRGSRRNRVDRVARFVPFQSLKIIIVAWQIVTQFASVANVTFPDIYQRFLDAIDVLNFDLSWVLSAGCVFSFDFHDQLLISTTMPIAGMILLGMTFVTAAGRHRHSKAALRIIRHKHVSMVLLITFLVYSSVSSTVFQMFACEDLEDGKNYLRADYRIECDSAKHKALQIYSCFMIMLYPVGIPCLYAGLLFKYRNVLNSAAYRVASSGADSISDLWKPYKPSHFYYEVIECVRRISLTGAVVFIYPNSAAQIAVTLVMAFVFTMVSEGLAPYDSRWDYWISRTGHVIVFMSMYIALLLKVNVSSEHARSQNVLASILVAAHVCMVLAVGVEAVAMACSVTKPQSRDEPRLRVSYRLLSRTSQTSDFEIHGV